MARVDTTDTLPRASERRPAPPGDIAPQTAAPIVDEILPAAKAPPGSPVIPAAREFPPLPSPIPDVRRSWRDRLPTLRTTLMAGGIFLVLIGSGVVWLRGGRYASTDDAYVKAAKLLVTTDVSGLVSTVNVHNNQPVKAGQLLFRIDPLQFQIALDNAKANLGQTALTIDSMKVDYQRMLSDVSAQEAQVGLDQVTYERFAELVKNDDVTRANYDRARYTLALDQGRLESLKQIAQSQLARLAGNPNIAVIDHPLYKQAKAQVDEAQRELDHTEVRAPFDGVVTQVDALQPGTYVVAQTAALTNTGAIALVSPEQTWIEAQMKETDLTYVRPGNHVDISVDTYPGRPWSGTVESISPASGSEFSILPPQNSSGNYVKVVQRIPVRIRVDRKPDDPPLRAGMSVYVDIDTGHRRSLWDLF